MQMDELPRIIHEPINAMVNTNSNMLTIMVMLMLPLKIICSQVMKMEMVILSEMKMIKISVMDQLSSRELLLSSIS